MTRIGVVGLGHWGSKVLEEYAALREEGHVSYVVGCDLDEGRLEDADAADERYQDVGETLDRVDGLHLCTPIGTHETIGRQTLEAGVDLLAEKPLTNDRDSAFGLLQLALREDRILQTGHIFRFANVVDRLRALYQTGQFGELQTVTLRWTHDVEAPPGTDVLWDLAPHPIDIMNYVTGDWPSDECCRTRTRPDADGPVSATAQFRLAGADVTMQLSWDDSVRRRDIEVAGTDASAVVEAVDQRIELFEAGSRREISVEANNTIRREAHNFVEAIQTRRNIANSGVVGVRTVEAIERLSAASNRD
ncbi:MAG: Gfo/Idh/MocA family protein [Halobaculum sp.]